MPWPDIPGNRHGMGPFAADSKPDAGKDLVLGFANLNAAPNRLEKIIFKVASGIIPHAFPGLKRTCLTCRGTCSYRLSA